MCIYIYSEYNIYIYILGNTRIQLVVKAGLVNMLTRQ